jgi:hypothetical protein
MRKFPWRLGLKALLLGLVGVLTTGCGPASSTDSKGSKSTTAKDSKVTPPPPDRE